MHRTAALALVGLAVLAAPTLTPSAPASGPDAAGAAAAEPGAAPPTPDPVASPVPPASPAPPAEEPVAETGAEGEADPLEGARLTPEGHLLAGGTAAAGAGPVLRYTVEIHPETGLDPGEVAVLVETALGDVRSWARIRRLERVPDPGVADARLVVAPPDVVDALCAEAGLDTAGVFSCWNGRFVALNAGRWASGALGFPDLATYRRYLVNHEVGHVLGFRHVGCPAEGALAPLMMQQSKGLDGCVANAWPYP